MAIFQRGPPNGGVDMQARYEKIAILNHYLALSRK